MFYRLHSLVIDSEVPLPELPQWPEGPADFSFAVILTEQLEPQPDRWAEERRRADGRLAYALAHGAEGDRVHFPGSADFLVSTDNRQVRCHALSSVPPQTIRHLFLDLLFPFLLSRRGEIVLHGSAVARGSEAIAFVASSGCGKSTLAASFVADGFRLLSDDSVLLREEADRLLVVPSYPSLRLWPDTVSTLLGNTSTLPPVAHYLPKQRVGTEHGHFEFTDEHLPLERVYVLDQPAAADCALTPLTAREAWLHLVRNTMSLDHGNPEALKRGFDNCTRLARRPIFRLLSYRREFEVLPEVRRRVLEDLREERTISD
jgi:hypothetical protein